MQVGMREKKKNGMDRGEEFQLDGWEGRKEECLEWWQGQEETSREGDLKKEKKNEDRAAQEN